MGIFLLLINFVIFISIFYLQKLSTNKKKFSFFFCFILFTSLIIYNFKGNKNSFSYTYKLEKEISESTNDPEKFANLNPRKIVFFLENKLKKQPNDFEGWMLLARTCFISGHFQKADLYYNTALKFFPNNEVILYELAMLRKNTNQLMSALSILEKIYQINPRNLNSIKLNLEILKKINNKKLLNAKINKLKKENLLKNEEINFILEKMNL